MERWLDLTADGARRAVTLDREFRTDPADLWQAITDPERASRWLESLTIEGDAVTIGFDGGSTRSGRILECEAPHRLRVVLDPETEHQSFLAVALEPTTAGTKLVMQQDGWPPIMAALFAGGWQHHAERLDAATGGSASQTPFPELIASYREAEAAAVAGWITRTDDGAQVELERVIGAARAEVWDAMTNPDRIGAWWPTESSEQFEQIDRQDGAELSFRNANGVELTIALSDHPSGTLLRLRQSPAADQMAAGKLRSGPDYAAGWHSIVDALVGHLTGIALPEGDAMWQAAYAVYLARLAGWD
ncbi:MAG TPA: SRPBCC domain-containing protein [Pseudolysinimonas sp.]|jgi:uncharacterized protein YndB with AHSA1/START domain